MSISISSRGCLTANDMRTLKELKSEHLADVRKVTEDPLTKLLIAEVFRLRDFIKECVCFDVTSTPGIEGVQNSLGR